MPTAGISHDLTIEDGSAVKTGWMLERTGANSPSFVRKRAPIYTPSGRTGRSVFTTYPVPPAHDLTWEPDDFSMGFGMYRWSPWDSADQQARYAYADGVWTDTEQELSLAQAVKEADFLIQNPGIERGVTTGWTAGANTTLAVGTVPNSGDFSLNIVVTSGNAGQASQALGNYILLGSRTVTFRVMCKKTAGAGAEDWALKVDDGVGTTTGTAVVLTSAYQELTVTRAVTAVPTKLDLILLRGTPPANACTIEADDFIETARFGEDGGGAISKFATHRGLVYAMTTQAIMVWDTTNLKFSPVRVLADSTGAFTDMVSFGGNLYLARGNATAYEYTANPNTLLSNSWTVSTLAGNSGRDLNANFFVRVRDLLWKARSPVTGDNSSVAWIVDPTNAGSVVWAELAAGDLLANFTGLWAFNDTPVAGKTTGLWVYSRASNQFFDIAPEYEAYPSTFHWSKATAWRGWLYANADPQALWRYDGSNFQEVGFLLEAPQFDDMTARVLAIGHNSQRMFVLCDTIDTNNSVGETTWLSSLREIRIGQSLHWVIHTEHELVLGGTTQALHFDANILFAGGGIKRTGFTKNMATAYRITQPTLGTPSHGQSQDLRFTAPFVSPWWDGGYPDSNKALRQLVFRVEGLDSTHTVKVEIQIDEDSSFTNLTTFNTNGLKTASIETLANTKKAAKRCRFQFTLNAGSSATAPRTYPTTSPKIKLPFILHTSVLPTRHNELEFKVLVADNLPILAGLEHQTAAQLLTILNGYIDNATFPITIAEDLDGDGTITTYRAMIQEVIQTEQFESPERGRVTIYQVHAIEVSV